jgi:hypothetical protein
MVQAADRHARGRRELTDSPRCGLLSPHETAD